MSNGPLFASNELKLFLHHHCIDHITSSPHFPRSNSFIEHQVCMIKTTHHTSQDSRKTLEYLLLDLHSTPIEPNMPSPREILHNRTLQCPGRPSTPDDMESVRNYLLSRKQSQKVKFDRAYGACELQQLGPGQEVLFWFPSDDAYIPRSIVNKATVPCSYIVEAQGNHYHRTSKHLEPVHVNIPSPITHQPQPP